MASNWYSTNHTFAASSCGAAALPQPTFAFGFPAAHLHLANTCGVPVYWTLTGDAATTANGYLSTGEVRLFSGFRAGTLGLMTTSTSTGAGAQPRVSITAWAE